MKTFSTARDFNVLEVYVHPKFEEIKDVITYDFALLRLDYPIADNAYGIGFASKYSPEEIMPICLPSNKNFQDIEKSVTVVGSGLERANCITTSQGNSQQQQHYV
ncbi:uncharacterized protein LOC111713763 [Eurytemora carolleeae]|uniref:uncharacterized protein LOC111713763 n=1 Tax=Eurytemora carolleeae TaxID=1294199 RepID=UPI000C766E18|nr:uncharacterized protein LOC111713763 [Eurytemora carolleeae]|eukprot:XP_023344477.1 uncharacterized protein LOC111713763 [Eurytemora affinis]